MKKRWKDRRDAKRVDMPGLMQCCIDLKPKRMENEVYINQKMDVTGLSDYLAAKKAQGEHYTYFMAFLTAIGRVMYNRPKLNRFITNRHMYEHNDVTLSFVAKMSLADKSEEIMLIVPIEPQDNMASIAAKVTRKVENLRGKSVTKGGANSAIDVLCKLPNILRVPVFGLIKLLDRIDLLPAGIKKDNIYFSSMIISNLGSIRCGAIYHNLASFGSCSSLATMGEIRTEKVLQEDGSEVLKQLCEFGITLDERIGDGYYFAKSAKLIEYVLMHPELLEEPVSKPLDMGELR